MASSAWLVTALLFAWVSEQPEVPEPVLGKPFALKAGEKVTLAGEGLGIEFLEVAGDSRCPVDVTCVWEGDATVQLELSRPAAAPTRLELHTSPRFGRTARHHGLRFELLELRPPPRSDAKPEPSEYVAKLEIRRE